MVALIYIAVWAGVAYLTIRLGAGDRAIRPGLASVSGVAGAPPDPYPGGGTHDQELEHSHA